MYQQTLDSAMALHHCALYFLAAGEFFLEFFHIVHARQHLLLQGLEPEGDGGAALFPPDPSGEGFDIYHLPLQGVLMWLVALELPGTEVARVLRHVADPSATPAETAQEVSKALDSLFAPSHDYWRAVLHGSSGMGLSEQAEAEERERRHANLSCLHHLAARLRADLSRADAGEEGGVAPGGSASEGGCALLERVPGPGAGPAEGRGESSETAAVEAVFARYLEGAQGFSELCASLGTVPGVFRGQQKERRDSAPAVLHRCLAGASLFV